MPAHAWALGAISACVLLLSSCTFADQNTNNGKAAPPSAAAAAAAMQPAGPSPMDTFRALAPPEGMKFTPLFAVPVKDEGQRFARLEQSVQALRNDFDTVTPTLVRLAAVEKDIRDLVSQLRTLDDSGPIVEAVPVAPVATAPMAATTSPVPPASNVTAQVKPPAAPAAPTPNTLPSKGVTGGTEAAPATTAVAGKPAASLPVTPEAALSGQLPPAGAASPSLPTTPQGRVVVQAPKPAATAPSAPVATAAAPVVAPAPTAPVKTPPPLDLTPVMPEQAAVAPAVTPAAPATAPAAPAVAPKVVMGDILGDVRAIRIGDHIDKTRIVLDVTAKAPFKVRLENEGRRVIIELPQYAWKADPSWRARSAALVSGYQYADGALVLDLLAPASIRQQVSLPAGDGAGPRVMVDLFAPLVHVE